MVTCDADSHPGINKKYESKWIRWKGLFSLAEHQAEWAQTSRG
jgi:hypothetical protein